MAAKTKSNGVPGVMTLTARVARELMTPDPLTVCDKDTVKDAIRRLIENGISAAPVVDGLGRPIGVFSRSDVVSHDRSQLKQAAGVPDYYDRADLRAPDGESLEDGFQVERPDDTEVGDLMTPVIYAVPPDAPAWRVVRDMLDLKVHRLFVVDRRGAILGVISALDVLRHLHA